MFLRKATRKKTGRTYLSIVHGYWDPACKQSRTKTVQKIGYLDELEKEYDDPITHFTKVAQEMEEERKAEKYLTVTLDKEAQLEEGDVHRKNYGHVLPSKLYHQLELDRFLDNARRHENFKFNTEAIMRLLVFTRLLFPGSKRAAHLCKEHFFDNFNFSLDDIYDGLTHFDKIADALQRHLHEQVTKLYGRNTDHVYYDVTNYYFEIDRQDDFRKRGFSKENRKDPLVQMGLLLDQAGLPISYQLFPGNTHDSQTLLPTLTKVKKAFDIGRIVIVADKALNSGDNIAYNTILADGYIYSKSVRGGSEEFQKWVLSPDNYRETSNNYKLKSKVVPDAKINITINQVGNKKTKKSITIEQKWVAYYSEKYAKRAKHKREEAIQKAIKMIENPTKYRRTFDYGAAGYIENLKIDKETGEIKNITERLFLDQKKIEEEEKFDGYYAIVTSELDETDETIVAAYKKLWHIEESFKVTKSVLGTRPIYLQNRDHINAHFLICFIALLLGRIIEQQLDGKYTIAKITETLRKVECSHIDQNVWLFDYVDEVTKHMNTVFGTDFGKKVMTLHEIKKNLGYAKKS